VVIGDADASQLGKYGAAKVYQAKGEHFDITNTCSSTRALEAAIKECDPTFILGAASPCGKDIFPRLAARLEAGLGADINGLQIKDGNIVGRRAQFTGRVFSDVQITSEKQLFTVRPGTFSVPQTSSNKAEVISLNVELEDVDISSKIIEVIKSEVEVVDLTEAERIVSGGRSVKSKENYDSLIRPLALSIGATPGASRACVDAGYTTHSHQVGQTGKVVNPILYIACGISGAIQHLAGMRTSRIIVSINKDKDAPIFKHSTYGIVADMFDVIPVLTKALSGGEIPVAKAKPRKSSEVTTKTSEPTSVEPTPAKVTAKPATHSTPIAVKKDEPSTVEANVQKSTTSVPSVDPRAVEELKSELSSLKLEISKLRDGFSKSFKESNAVIKKDIQRVEQNARSFQDSALKRVETIDRSTINEVRRIREKTREAIANDTDSIKKTLFSLKGTVSASIVINVLCLSAILVLFFLQ
jgi:electron transfer flavoprotein alpha subunit